MVEWQRQNEASVYRTAKEFADDRKCVREWCQCYSTLKGQARGVLRKCHRLHCGQPLSVDLDHWVSGGREKRRKIGVESASTELVSPSRRGPGRGGYSRDKMSDPAYKPSLRFRLVIRLQNRGHICGTLRYMRAKFYWQNHPVAIKSQYHLISYFLLVRRAAVL